MSEVVKVVVSEAFMQRVIYEVERQYPYEKGMDYQEFLEGRKEGDSTSTMMDFLIESAHSGRERFRVALDFLIGYAGLNGGDHRIREVFTGFRIPEGSEYGGEKYVTQETRYPGLGSRKLWKVGKDEVRRAVRKYAERNREWQGAKELELDLLMVVDAETGRIIGNVDDRVTKSIRARR